ncbi:MAG: hypothetical protein AUI88_02470 [Gemmatimonadetes bacterium 13_1_40CM_3_70_8]|nr:MAG: hypothetical protein AUI88_02470 [Gemmatimonadetes bacterium 13_1_40CM_3_70_8]
MKPRLIGVILGGAALAAWACKGDPTADLRNGPTSLNVSRSKLFIDTGSTTSLVVTPRDAQLNPVNVDVTVTSADPTVAKVTLDATRTFPDASTHAYIIEAFSPNRTKLTVTGAGLTDSVIVYVLPTELRGAISNTAPAAGSPITIQATPGLKFTNASTVTFGGGAVGFISQFTPDQLQVITPYSDAGILTINHIDVAYDPGLTITLSTFAKVTPTGDVWTAADTGYGTAPALPIPAVNDSAKFITDFKPGTANAAQLTANCAEWGAAGPPNFSKGPCVMYRFDVAGPDSLNLLFRVDWDNDATDVDIYTCTGTVPVDPANDCFSSGTQGASGRKPEFLRDPLVGGVRTPSPFKYKPGTHWLVLELFDGSAPRNVYVTVFRKP